jgi:hypothetical protein
VPRVRGILGPYRVFFTSFDCREPPHVHSAESSSSIISESWRHGMTIAVSSEPIIRDVRVTKSEIIAYLEDVRVISVPLAWSWRLSEATPVQRVKFRLIGAGQGIHWPDVDEDISVEGMLRGSPAPRAPVPRQRSSPAKRRPPKARKAAKPPMQRTASARR